MPVEDRHAVGCWAGVIHPSGFLFLSSGRILFATGSAHKEVNVKKLSLIALAMLVGLGSSEAGTKPPALTAPRTYVSPSGVDSIYANPACANIASPCQTLNYALSQTSWGGEVIVVASGSYAPVTITNSVTIEAAPGVYAGITAPASGAGVTVIGVSGALVVLRGLTITIPSGGADGIDFDSGADLSVEHCVINGSASEAPYYTGIYQGARESELFVKDTVIENFYEGAGVVIYSSSYGNSLSHVLLEDNDVGLVAVEGAATISNSVSGSNYQGILAVGGEVNVESCQVANNYNGIEVDSGVGRVSNSTVTDNFGTGLYNEGGTLYSRLNNTVAGNGPPDEAGTITPLSPL